MAKDANYKHEKVKDITEELFDIDFDRVEDLLDETRKIASNTHSVEIRIEKDNHSYIKFSPRALFSKEKFFILGLIVILVTNTIVNVLLLIK